MNTQVAVATDPGAIMESVLIKGDLSKLTPQERSTYYTEVCRSIGINPLTKPFEYITLNGKLTLYAKRDCADQLRKINGISIEIVSKAVLDGLITVHVRATDKTGRSDEDFGVVNVAGAKGEIAANAMMKAVTKAKRRVTLSISGLGFLDETEVDDIPGTAKRPPPRPAPLKLATPEPIPEPPAEELPDHDLMTGEVLWEDEREVDVPEAGDYVDRWSGILDAAVPKHAAQIESAWKEEAHLRDLINWQDDQTRPTLQRRVIAVLNELKKG
jgi:hypothetical protein